MVHKIRSDSDNVLIGLLEEILKKGDNAKLLIKDGVTLELQEYMQIRILNNDCLEVFKVMDSDEVICARILLNSIAGVVRL